MLASLLAPLSRSDWFLEAAPLGPTQPSEQRPLPGKNSVSNLTVRQKYPGVWTADFDYYYTGEPEHAALRIELLPASGPPAGAVAIQSLQTQLVPPQPGTHHVSSEIAYPSGQMQTRWVTAKMLKAYMGDEVVASQRVESIIDWPDFTTYIRNELLAHDTPEDSFRRAVGLIDSEGEPQLAEAKSILEGLIARNPRFDAAYVELARVAMKQSWGPQGLHQAESLLASALQIRPDSANAKILLGYVYANQKRFPEAEALFTDAARSNPPNLWLWSNWGELYLMQGKVDQAIGKFREAISRPMTHDTYDRARNHAYQQLLALLERRKAYDAMEALYRQRVTEFGPGACYTADYAQFKLQIRGDVQGAIDLARGALNQNCEDSDARRILGLADYVKWASGSDPQRAAALNEARLYLPPGPTALYMLATSTHTAAALKPLLAAGEKIDEQDNEGMTALAYALQNHDLQAARRLLGLGARPDVQLSAGVPLALMPVMEGNIDGIRLLRQFGVDYSKVRFRGATALDYAKQTGNQDLLHALTDRSTEL
jgi:tetratricopeptide (TPR) repeat protein